MVSDCFIAHCTWLLLLNLGSIASRGACCLGFSVCPSRRQVLFCTALFTQCVRRGLRLSSELIPQNALVGRVGPGRFLCAEFKTSKENSNSILDLYDTHVPQDTHVMCVTGTVVVSACPIAVFLVLFFGWTMPSLFLLRKEQGYLRWETIFLWPTFMAPEEKCGLDH